MRNLLGYHGTSKINSSQILEEKSFLIDQNEGRNDHWLGYGAYFFNEDYMQAGLWGKAKYGHKSSVILEVDIVASRDKILDLETRIGLEYLEEFIKDVQRTERILLKVEDLEKRTPEIIHFYLTLIPNDEKWIILKNFSIHSKKYDDSKELSSLSFSHKGIQADFKLKSPQICVRNNSAIQKISLYGETKGNGLQRVKVRREKGLYDLFNK